MTEEDYKSGVSFLTVACVGRRYVSTKHIKMLADAVGASIKDTESFYLKCLQDGVHLPPLVVSPDLFEEPESRVRFI